ncbi:histone lysine methyltransferase Set9 [Batrachochytrium dendrobatidis]|nr:histone lysine methyltransferase Set9 [Batrachochytrium dendrobatidis]
MTKDKAAENEYSNTKYSIHELTNGRLRKINKLEPAHYSTLAEYDDVLTDALIDTVFMDFKTHKIAEEYSSKGEAANLNCGPDRAAIARVVIDLIRYMGEKALSLDEATEILVHQFWPNAPKDTRETAEPIITQSSNSANPNLWHNQAKDLDDILKDAANLCDTNSNLLETTVSACSDTQSVAFLHPLLDIPNKIPNSINKEIVEQECPYIFKGKQKQNYKRVDAAVDGKSDGDNKNGRTAFGEVKVADCDKELMDAKDVSADQELEIPIPREPAFSYYDHVFMSKTENDFKHFKDHVRRYLSIYTTNAGFEIDRTDRYLKFKKAEARIVATREWKTGDEIYLCSGIFTKLNSEEERSLAQRDFSVMFSTKRHCMGLFLGPARFANHDCCANCKFNPVGRTNAIYFKVTRDINIGEEITCYYSDNYFGQGNCECLCESCERLNLGGFAPLSQTNSDGEVVDSKTTLKRIRKERKSTGFIRTMASSHSTNGYDGTKSNVARKQQKCNADTDPSLKTCHSCGVDIIGFQLSRFENSDPDLIFPKSVATKLHKDDLLDTISDCTRNRVASKPNTIIELDVSVTTTELPVDSIIKVSAQSAVDHSHQPKFDSTFQVCDKTCTPFNSDTTVSSGTVMATVSCLNVSTKTPPMLTHCNDSINYPSLETTTQPDQDPIYLADMKTTFKSCSDLNMVTTESAASSIASTDQSDIYIKKPKHVLSSNPKKIDVPFKEENTYCVRCLRHFLIFGLNWPLRKPLITECPNSFWLENRDGQFRFGNTIFISKKQVDNGLQGLVGQVNTQKPTVSNHNTLSYKDRINLAFNYGRKVPLTDPTNNEAKYKEPLNVFIPSKFRCEDQLFVEECDAKLESKTKLVTDTEYLSQSKDTQADTVENRLISCIDQVGGVQVMDFDKMTAVFVYTGDPECPYWWPAVLIPSSEVDGSIQKPKGNWLTLTYLETPKLYTFTTPEQTRIFDPTQEPYLTFIKHPEFVKSEGRICMLKFLENLDIPEKCRWKHYGRSASALQRKNPNGNNKRRKRVFDNVDERSILPFPPSSRRPRK